MMVRSLLAACLTVTAMLAAGPAMQIRDLSGKLQEIVVGGDVVVVTFISTGCPVSNAYNDRMIALYDDYSKKGVKFFFVNANANESAADVAAHRKESGYLFAVYKDESAADRLDPQATPETFVFDKAGKLQYHGYIDDSRTEARIQHNGLRVALDEVLTGHAVTRASTKAFGCSIKRARKR